MLELLFRVGVVEVKGSKAFGGCAQSDDCSLRKVLKGLKEGRL